MAGQEEAPEPSWRYLEVVYVEGQPLRELTTTPSVAEGDRRSPENPLESLRAETDRSPSW